MCTFFAENDRTNGPLTVWEKSQNRDNCDFGWLKMAKCQKFWVWGTQKFQKTFFAQNHSIRENKVKKVKKDEFFFFSFPIV